MQTKNILVTGVSRGLGLEITRTLLSDTTDNYHVYGISRRSTPQLEELKKQHEGRFDWLAYDLSNYNDVAKVVFKQFIGFATPLHGYVNNAAIAYDDIVTNLRYEPLLAMYQVNVFTPMIMTKYAIRHFLLHNTSGSIVHLSSISVHTGYKGLAMYASSKGALEAFSKNTAREWGERNVRSNCLVAGFMETDMSSTLTADQKDRIYKRTSMKRPTTTSSVANTISFLLSDKAASITAQNIHVDSGTI